MLNLLDHKLVKLSLKVIYAFITTNKVYNFDKTMFDEFLEIDKDFHPKLPKLVN